MARDLSEYAETSRFLFSISAPNIRFVLATQSASLPAVMTITDTEREIFRKMTPADKLRLVTQLHIQAREWKKAAFRAQHRDWTAEQVAQRTREVFLYGTD
jgi:hypothetical protein